MKFKTKKLKIKISKELGSVSSLLMLPSNATHLLVMSHGAGAGMTHIFMETLAHNLALNGIGTLRFNFPYMEKGGGGPDRPPKAKAAILAAIHKGVERSEGLPLLLGGKSFGGRMSSLLAAEDGLEAVSGIIYFGFPLHAPGKPDTKRATHLKSIKKKQLFLQGTRDTLAQIDLIKEVCKPLRKAKLSIMEGGDHSFKVLKRSGLDQEAVYLDMAKRVADFAKRL